MKMFTKSLQNNAESTGFTQPVPTPDAAGGAKAMREAADAAIADLAAWLDRLSRPAP